MPPLPRVTATLLAASLLAVASARGQKSETHPPDCGSVAAQLDRLNGTLARMAELLEHQVEGQRLEVSLKRVELANHRAESVESALAQARSERTSLEDNHYLVSAQLESLASQAERSDPESLPAVEEQVRETQRTLDLLKARIKEREQRILELENELARRQRDLEALQDRLDRELEGL